MIFNAPSNPTHSMILCFPPRQTHPFNSELPLVKPVIGGIQESSYYSKKNPICIWHQFSFEMCLIRSVPLAPAPGLTVWHSVYGNNPFPPSSCWIYFVPRDLTVLPWSETCSWRGEDLGKSSGVNLLQKSTKTEGSRSHLHTQHWKLS